MIEKQSSSLAEIAHSSTWNAAVGAKLWPLMRTIWPSRNGAVGLVVTVGGGGIGAAGSKLTGAIAKVPSVPLCVMTTQRAAAAAQSTGGAPGLNGSTSSRCSIG